MSLGGEIAQGRHGAGVVPIVQAVAPRMLRIGMIDGKRPTFQFETSMRLRQARQRAAVVVWVSLFLQCF